MTKRIAVTLCFVAAICITMAAQTEPTLTALSMPHYSRLARQARVQGVIKVAFTLLPHSGETTNIELVSGRSLSDGAASKLLTELAMENVKTWRFENQDAIEHRYETTFEFRLSNGKDTVSFQSFHYVAIEVASEGSQVID